MSKKPERLDNIGCCLACGAKQNVRELDRDHFLPKCLSTYPKQIPKDTNPFRQVVLRRQNVFVLCRDDHNAIDEQKIRAFGGNSFEKIDPVSLIQFLREGYPITENPRYRELMLKHMITTYLRFAERCTTLNGELPGSLVSRFHLAAGEATMAVSKLTGLLADFRRTGYIDP